MNKEEARNVMLDLKEQHINVEIRLALDMAIEALKAQPEWISCSERLPEEGEVVLTQAKFRDGIKMAVSARQDYNYWTGWGTREINILAWMPLPEPYKEESEDK